ncbi:alpha/beta hydrolase [Desulfallas thermosapovorans]|uniref:Serine aminopeptidase S33 family n=1 Tax=Desulfallas thermosapovorans DSM 6562 TaxID=1121431 RepID=A0A5S4ZSE9_9FIRM|nr:serine aminopeptidase S33 family [Desulfallas thermosapovorans DSM 6562]
MKSKPNNQLTHSKTPKIILWAAIGLISLAAIVVLGISAYVGWNLTHPVREEVTGSPADIGLAYENVSFKSREDGLNLSGWLIKSPGNEQTVIFAHGYRKNRMHNTVPLLPIADFLVDKGCNVLMFDFRNSGQSDGELTSVGQYEVRDLLGAIDFIKTRRDLNQQIILIGYSMGAATSILAGAREPAVAGVIADAPFADLRSYLMANLSVWSKLPAIPFNQAFFIIVPPLTGLNVGAVSPVNEVKNFNGRPLLLIHGEGDTDIPIENSELLQKAYPRASFWRVPEAKHCKSYEVTGDLYLQKISSFLDKVKENSNEIR